MLRVSDDCDVGDEIDSHTFILPNFMRSRLKDMNCIWDVAVCVI